MEGLALAGILLLANVFLLLFLQLKLHWRILFAAARAVAQLYCLGLIFTSIFETESYLPVVVMTCCMVAIATVEALQSPHYVYQGMFPAVLVSMAISSVPVVLIAVRFIMGLGPDWWKPRFFLPIAGIMISHSLYAISLTVDRLLSVASDRKDSLDELFARGVSYTEATLPLQREAVRVGLLPLLNQLSVVGLVAIPGMMTGQLLGGADPLTAASYQIMVLLLIATTQGIASVAVSSLVLRDLKCSQTATLCWRRITHRGKQQSDWPVQLAKAAYSRIGTARRNPAPVESESGYVKLA